MYVRKIPICLADSSPPPLAVVAAAATACVHVASCPPGPPGPFAATTVADGRPRHTIQCWPTWQGNSLASWTREVGGFDMRAIFGDPKDTPKGPIKASLEVETDNLRPGYLRKNGVPYSEQTRLQEYFSTVEYGSKEYLTVLSIVHDPVYLSGDFVTSSQFRKEADDANWNPSPCYTAPPAPQGDE